MNIEDAKILVLDDDKVMRSFVVNSLRRLGVQAVFQAADGGGGYAMMDEFQPDVVLSDIHMHPVGGLEFVGQLRAHPVVALRKTPVILMSADDSADPVPQAVPLGIFAYLVKPPQLPVLKEKLERALKFRSRPEPLKI